MSAGLWREKERSCCLFCCWDFSSLLPSLLYPQPTSWMGSNPTCLPRQDSNFNSVLCSLLGHRDWQVSLGNTSSGWNFPGIEPSPCFWSFPFLSWQHCHAFKKKDAFCISSSILSTLYWERFCRQLSLEIDYSQPSWGIGSETTWGCQKSTDTSPLYKWRSICI